MMTREAIRAARERHRPLPKGVLKSQTHDLACGYCCTSGPCETQQLCDTTEAYYALRERVEALKTKWGGDARKTNRQQCLMELERALGETR